MKRKLDVGVGDIMRPTSNGNKYNTKWQITKMPATGIYLSGSEKESVGREFTLAMSRFDDPERWAIDDEFVDWVVKVRREAGLAK